MTKLFSRLICVYIYIYIYICVCVCIYIYIYVCVCIYIYIYICVCVCVCVCIYMNKFFDVNIEILVSAGLYARNFSFPFSVVSSLISICTT